MNLIKIQICMRNIVEFLNVNDLQKIGKEAKFRYGLYYSLIMAVLRVSNRDQQEKIQKIEKKINQFFGIRLKNP